MEWFNPSGTEWNGVERSGSNTEGKWTIPVGNQRI